MQKNLETVWRTFLFHSRDWRFWVCWVGSSMASPFLCDHLSMFWLVVVYTAWACFFSLVAFPAIKEDKP